jgi:hypothetical protein
MARTKQTARVMGPARRDLNRLDPNYEANALQFWESTLLLLQYSEDRRNRIPVENTQERELHDALIIAVQLMSECAYLEKEAAAGTGPVQDSYYTGIDQTRFNYYVSARSGFELERAREQNHLPAATDFIGE